MWKVDWQIVSLISLMKKEFANQLFSSKLFCWNSRSLMGLTNMKEVWNCKSIFVFSISFTVQVLCYIHKYFFPHLLFLHKVFFKHYICKSRLIRTSKILNTYTIYITYICTLYVHFNILLYVYYKQSRRSSSPVLSFFMVAFKSVKFMVKFDSAAFAFVSRRQLGLSILV